MPPSEARRLNDLLGLPVVFADGTHAGFVNDVRLAPPPDRQSSTLLVEGLLVDGRHAGSLLGYDRRHDQGPWAVRALVRSLHRNAGYADWSDVAGVDWDQGRVRLATSRLGPLLATDQ
jgi:sporulation protein YlmC with PRC-barrel domain